MRMRTEIAETLNPTQQTISDDIRKFGLVSGMGVFCTSHELSEQNLHDQVIICQLSLLARIKTNLRLENKTGEVDY
ncbi:hypothetical protein HZH66_014646 [Vespula vulgaris]|uniref:Uncharacterized protein n=1 Tax=Vespula vulgaris TaxID=7454 RepID=A0A834J370_VESVU|nr:hypothetical protein HZH66_014646 [Vespula vulgaris]